MPSPKDHQVAAQARQRLLTVQLELAQQQSAERQSAPQAGGRDGSDSPATQRDRRVEHYTAIEATSRDGDTEALLRAVA
ncbi:hypothetical protein [Halomonas sp. 25-S5]|uniref:hypothetical protein n=1 Tax=Halomonas sp. 25-S5 TaxID=2994065 RepID=UPI0024682AA0|nr:hypothetical protein [Halomonas sp. 25-S5]